MARYSTRYFVGRPNLGDTLDLLEQIKDILDRRWLTNDGPVVREFEARVAELVEVKHCVAVCNATAGLQLLAHALGLAGEVIVPSFTFIATPHALTWLGIRPVFADIDPRSHTLDPESVARAITPRTTGILAVHTWGRPCNVAALAEVAQQHGLELIFDAAHAFGCSHGGRMIGGFGHAEVFSFHATKFVHSLEGGAITTNDDELASQLRQLRNFGYEDGEVCGLGINAKMSEISAAFGLNSLDAMDRFVSANVANHAAYLEHLGNVPGIRLMTHDPHERHNYQYVVAEANAEVCGVHRDEILQALVSENVFARRYFHPGCHRVPPYMEQEQFVPLPNTEQLADRVLVLPTGTAATTDDVARISAIIEGAHATPKAGASFQERGR